MLKNDKRIRIFIGHYGSGKTEVAVNYALKLTETSEKKVALADLDVVNLYFRSRERQKELEDKGIRVISSSIEGGALDLPAVSAEVMSPMEDHSYDYVIDVGGDSVGGRVLGRFSHLIEDGDYDMFMVINANREQTQNLDEVLHHLNSIEKTTRLKVTGLINNTHLVRDTTIDDVIKGDSLVKEVSEATGLKVRYVSAIEQIANHIPEGTLGEVFKINLMMRTDWM